MMSIVQGLWVACESISIFAGVIEYEKRLLHFNARLRGRLDLKVVFSLSVISNKRGSLISSNRCNRIPGWTTSCVANGRGSLTEFDPFS